VLAAASRARPDAPGCAPPRLRRGPSGKSIHWKAPPKQHRAEAGQFPGGAPVRASATSAKGQALAGCGSAAGAISAAPPGGSGETVMRLHVRQERRQGPARSVATARRTVSVCPVLHGGPGLTPLAGSGKDGQNPRNKAGMENAPSSLCWPWGSALVGLPVLCATPVRPGTPESES